MRGQTLAVTIVVVSLLGTGAAFAGPIITNGSFEAVQIGSPFFSANPADIPGWTHGGSPGDALLWGQSRGSERNWRRSSKCCAKEERLLAPAADGRTHSVAECSGP